MRAIATVGLVGALLAGCGSGSDNDAQPTPGASANAGGGGVVKAEPTKGLLLPPVTVVGGKVLVIGEGGPISPKEDRPTDAQRSGVAGSGACASTSANPSPGNLTQMAAAIRCLLANILHASFRDIGIGIKLGAPGQGLSGGATYVTDFGKH